MAIRYNLVGRMISPHKMLASFLPVYSPFPNSTFRCFFIFSRSMFYVHPFFTQPFSQIIFLFLLLLTFIPPSALLIQILSSIPCFQHGLPCEIRRQILYGAFSPFPAFPIPHSKPSQFIFHSAFRIPTSTFISIPFFSSTFFWYLF